MRYGGLPPFVFFVGITCGRKFKARNLLLESRARVDGAGNRSRKMLPTAIEGCKELVTRYTFSSTILKLRGGYSDS